MTGCPQLALMSWEWSYVEDRCTSDHRFFGIYYGGYGELSNNSRTGLIVLQESANASTLIAGQIM